MACRHHAIAIERARGKEGGGDSDGQISEIMV